MNRFKIIALMLIAIIMILPCGCMNTNNDLGNIVPSVSNSSDLDTSYDESIEDFPSNSSEEHKSSKTISAFTDVSNSWDELFSREYYINYLMDDPSFKRTTMSIWMKEEDTTVEKILVDDEVITLAIVGKGYYDAGEKPGYRIAYKNNTDRAIHINATGNEREGFAATINEVPQRSSLYDSLEPPYIWTLNSLTFKDLNSVGDLNNVDVKLRVNVSTGASTIPDTYWYDFHID